MDDNTGPLYLRRRDVDSSYTIPKRSNVYDYDNPLSEGRRSTVLSNAYGNFLQSSQSYSSGFGTWRGQQSSNSSYPSYVQYPTQYPLNYKSGGSSGLKRVREEPKGTKSEMTYRDTIPDLNDATLPRELSTMFQPLYCKLCSVQLSSTVMAKLHYNSKNHDKKVRKFLVDYSISTGEPLHKRAKYVKGEMEEEDNPKYFHCDICDLPLTGKAHADSHYMGKNHQKVVMGKRAPTGKGFYNEFGNWVRTTPAKSDSTGRDGFGQDFIISKEEALTTSENGLRCDLCNVSVTSLPQMEMHLQGQKHLKRLKNKQSGFLPSFDGGSPDLDQSGESPTSKSGQQSVLSSYRTPSGQFYCKNCNISLNSETQFMQHLNSKKHVKKGSSTKEQKDSKE